MAFHVRFCDEDWRSSCFGLSCSTRAIQELPDINTMIQIGCLVLLTFVKGTGTKVQAKVRLGANNLTPLHEFIGTKFVRLGTNPGKLRPVSKLGELFQDMLIMIGRDNRGVVPAWPVLSRANTI
jgi:hypothetical protein